MDADHLRGIPLALAPDYPFAPQPGPSGDTCDGMGWFLDPVTQTLKLMQAHINCGAACPDGGIQLTGRVMTPLWGPVGGEGMRSGLVQYLPDGTWNLNGRIVFTGILGVEYRAFVYMGTAPSTDPFRPGVISEVPSLIGSGVGVCRGILNQQADSFTFDAYKFNARYGLGKACEVSVFIYANCDGPAGAVLHSLGPDGTGQAAIPATLNSNCFVWRANG